ncbi:Ribosomal RNA-processing protein 7 [Quaeritorhiza haematococci]|nr:Ribosomal RNA-processing protein 7 [Quaeritorhiza haematococci]
MAKKKSKSKANGEAAAPATTAAPPKSEPASVPESTKPKAEITSSANPASTTTDSQKKPSSSTSTTVLDTFASFKVLPITFPPITLSLSHITTFADHTPAAATESRAIEHCIYFKRHDVRGNSNSKKKKAAAAGGDDAEDGEENAGNKQGFSSTSLPQGRTLFLLNLPVDASEAHLRRLFRRCGEIQEVIIHNEGKHIRSARKMGKGEDEDNEDAMETVDDDESDEEEAEEKKQLERYLWIPHRSGCSAHVIFSETAAVDRALNMTKRRRVWSDREEDGEGASGGHLHGMQKWISQFFTHSRTPLSTLQSRVDAHIKDFLSEEAARRAELLAKRNQPDEDGFVLVTRARGRRNTNTDGSGATVTAARPDEVKALKPKSKELKNFYRFQMREEKRQQLADLRRKFEEDKRRIATLKAARRFKPY